MTLKIIMMVMLTKHNHGIDCNDNDGDVMMVLDCDEKNNQEDNDIKNQNGDIFFYHIF